MENNSKFGGYSVEDFIEDQDFRNWVIHPNEFLNSFWSEYQSTNPEQSILIEQARRVLQTIAFDEPLIAADEYEKSLNYLINYQSRKTNRGTLLSKILMQWGKVAAVLLIPLLAYNLYHFSALSGGNTSSQVVKYIVPKGQKSNLILSDGTKVWINSETSLTIPSDYSSKNRKVHLAGEAYFDVFSDSDHPFLVETKAYTIKVHGTNFNVRAYDYMKTTETVLKEGAVSILSSTLKDEIKIVPGQRFLFDENKRYTISEVNTEIYTDWKENVFKINNEKLEDLIIRMEHWYGVVINVKDYENYKNLRYTLTIKTESLREMLDLMNFITPLNYKVNGENVTLNYKSNAKPMM